MHLILAAMLAAPFACLAAAPPAGAQAAASVPAAIEVPFNPPLGTLVRYRVNRTRAATAERPAITVSWIEEQRFEKTESGYLAYWRMDWASLPPEMRAPMLAPMIKPMASEPIAFELDATGTVLRVHDWPATKAKILRAAEGAKVMIPANQAAAIMPKIRAMFDALDAEIASPMLLKNIGPVFEWGGVAMALGETRASQIEQPVALVNGTVLADATLTLSAASPGSTATFVSHIAVGKEAMQRLMEQIFARFRAIDAAAAERQRREIATAVEMSSEGTTVVDLATGLPLSVESRRGLSGASGKATETLTLTWLR